MNLQKKERAQYPAILTEQPWSIKDFLYGKRKLFLAAHQHSKKVRLEFVGKTSTSDIALAHFQLVLSKTEQKIRKQKSKISIQISCIFNIASSKYFSFDQQRRSPDNLMSYKNDLCLVSSLMTNIFSSRLYQITSYYDYQLSQARRSALVKTFLP